MENARTRTGSLPAAERSGTAGRLGNVVALSGNARREIPGADQGRPSGGALEPARDRAVVGFPAAVRWQASNACDEIGPLIHKLTPLGEQVATRVASLHVAPDGVS